MIQNPDCLLVCGKPRASDLSLIASLHKSAYENILFWSNNTSKSAFEKFEQLNVLYKSNNIYDDPDYIVVPRSDKYEEFVEFQQSEYFSDALHISDRVYPLNLSYNNAIACVYETYTKVACYLEYINPKTVLLDNTPHDLYAFCIFAYCKLSNIKVQFIKSGQHIDDFLTYLCSNISLVDYEQCFSLSSRSNVSANIIDNYQNRLVSSTPDYMYTNGTYLRENKAKRKIRQSVRLLKLKVFARLLGSKWPSLWMNTSKFSEFLNNTKRENIFYLPLHYQPEATTKPFASIYASQFIVFKRILDNLKKDDYIVIKEHPAMSLHNYFNLRRYRSPLYERYATHPQVKFAPIFYSNEEILSKSQNVVSIAGTTLIEASSGSHIVTTLVPTRYCDHKLISGLPLYQNNVSDIISYQGSQLELNEVYRSSFVEFPLPVQQIEVHDWRERDKKERMWRVLAYLLRSRTEGEGGRSNV
jgi:hypothetical protein